MVVQHNLLAMNAAYINKSTNNKLMKSTRKLASGLRINSAADDAANLSISEKMRMQIRGLNRGADNIMEGVGYCQTADGALAEVNSMLQRVNELAIQAANETNSDSDRHSINDEVQQLKSEIERICVTTKYNEEYIFRCEDEEEKVEEKEKYRLSFYGMAKDLYVYNDSYDPVDQTATYGGIAYNGKRYAWSAIDPNMYDVATGEFQEGKYLMHAEDGTTYTLICRNGTEPPALKREYCTQVSESGIIIGGETISWKDVATKDGISMNPDDIRHENYYFNYHGIEVSFIPDLDDEFEDVIQRLDGTIWNSENQIPTEQTALFADFSESKMSFQTDQQVKDVLDGKAVDFGLKLKAGDGTNGTIDGVWIEQNQNGTVTVLAGSEKTWADLGISNWGNMSEDIWDNLKYEYSFEDNGIQTVQFQFHMINETSKDSAIQALNDADLKPINRIYLDNGVEVEFHPTSANLIGMEKKSDNVNMSLATEYALGRDYTNKTWESAPTSFMLRGATNEMYQIAFGYNRDGVFTVEAFDSEPNEKAVLIDQVKNQIIDSYDQHMAVIKARYLAGAAEPEKIALSQIIGTDKITGNGRNTYLEDVFTLDSSDPDWKSTQVTAGSDNYACASIDFSGLGTSYELKDLIGTGFDATCQTCDNHYSVRFATDQSTQGSISWQTVNIDGNDYRFSRENDGLNYTILIDLDSMEQNGKTDGVSFSNVLVDLMGASKFAFHFNQYATNVNDATLVLFDNRPRYVENGVSTAERASFSPFSFDFNSIADFEFKMSNPQLGNFTLHYQYDFSNLFEKYKVTASLNPTGDYVMDSVSGRYVLYDPANPAHQGIDRYDVPDVVLDTQGKDLNTYIEEFSRDNVVQCAIGGTSVKLKSSFSGLQVVGKANINEAMVTSQGTPRQILPQKDEEEPVDTLNIQCSSTASDYLQIIKQKLSLSRLGIKKCNTLTANAAKKAIMMADEALQKVSDVRSLFGAYQNRLEHAFNMNRNTAENTQSAESKIRDTDMAEEMVEHSKNSILLQVGQSMLAQANQQSGMVMTLLQ